MKIKIQSLLLGIALFMPLLAWAGIPSFSRVPEHRYEVSDVRRDNGQRIIAKTICDVPYEDCIDYKFDAYGNLLMRVSEKVKCIFEYDNQGYLIKETEYNYPKGLKNKPEEARYLVRQSTYKPGTMKAAENYNTLIKGEGELSVDEQVNLRVQRELQEEDINSPLATIGAAAANVGMAIAFDYLKGEREARERRDMIITVSIVGGIVLLILLILLVIRMKRPASTTTLDS